MTLSNDQYNERYKVTQTKPNKTRYIKWMNNSYFTKDYTIDG